MSRKMAITSILILIFLIFASGIVAIGFAENNWAWKSGMHEGRSGLGVAVVDGKIYAIGGASASGFCSFNEQYDPIIGTWTLKAPMPTSRSAFGIAVFQNKIYCIGGYYLINNNQGQTSEVNEVYDPASNTWQTKAPLPTPELNIRANVVDGKVYAIGGNNNGTINQVYDPITDSWTIKASIPIAVTSYASAVVGNKIYIFTSNLTQSYDPKTDSWTICTSMPTGRYDVGVVVVDDLLYVIGGFTTEFSSEGFNPHPIYTYSPLNQQYTPIGYGAVPPDFYYFS